MKRKTTKRLGCLTNSKPQTHLKPKLTLFLFCLHLGFGVNCLAASEPATAPPAEQGRPAIVPGATELSPSRSQYFSWINNRNEGSTEAQTLINLEFFKWLHDEYGMQLDIYAFDAGNIDGRQYYGRMDTDKFKAQFPRGFAPIHQLAKSFGCRLGVWLGPDGFGDTPAEEQARIDMLVGLCRDYEFALFKMDAVCGQLRPEKQETFARLMTECRKSSPDLILLNHRLKLGSAQDYATTFLWQGAETYIDVHMANWNRTGTHNRVQAISRGLVPDLRRLTEDCGVCLSSCLDYWEDDLILQAFNRCLILAPELYGNPWFLRDDDFPRLARIFNLHQRYRDIMVKGMVLDAERYGPLAVARGDEATRLVTLRNLGWEPVVRRLKLDASIGFTAEGPIEVRQFHPCERILGTFKRGEEVPVEVLPFRGCLLLADAKQTGGVGLRGCDYEVVRDVPGRDVIIRVLGRAGETSEVSLVSGGKTFRRATLDAEPMLDLPAGQPVRVEFPGKPPSAAWHRRIGAPTDCAVPADAEALFESTCFAGDNDPLEIRSLRRSGPSKIPAVRKARQAFLDQPIIAEQGMLSDYLFDGDPGTFCDLLKTRERDPESRHLRIDLGKAVELDHLLLEPPATGELRYATVTPTNHADVSEDLRTWRPARLVQDGRNIRIECAAKQPVRYLRTDLVPEKLIEIRGFAQGKELGRTGWRASWLFPRFQKVCKAWSLPFSLDAAAPGSYLTVACNGVHGREGAWVALRVDGRWVGAPQRAPSYPVNPWEYPVSQTDRNYSYFVPVTPDMLSKACKVVVLAFDPKNLEFTPDVWLTAYPVPYQVKTLTLSDVLFAAAGVEINPGVMWKDEAGNDITAHGGCVIKVGKSFYWYGENNRLPGSGFGVFTGVNCYTSTDFTRWRKVGIVLSPTESGPLSAKDGRVAYRPKVLYNKHTAKYVMIVTETGAGGGHLLFATSPTPEGPFTYQGWSFGAKQSKTMDMGVYQEGEIAYLVYSDNNCGISIDRLNDDYLSVRQRVAHIRNNDCQCGPSHPSPNYNGWTLKGKTQVLKGGEEGPAIVKANEFYFLVTSWCSGWEPNQCHYRVSKRLEGPWNPEPDGYLGDDTSFKSQSGYILTITGNNGSTYINISDRWKGGNTEAGSTYPWLPLQINGSTMLLQWYDRWYLDLEAGTWSATRP